MLTVMCPNCRHRFPAPGCCNPVAQGPAASGGIDGGLVMKRADCPSSGSFYGGGYLLVPREYSINSGGCFINAPTIIHGPTIIQQPAMTNKAGDPRGAYTNDAETWKTLDSGHQSDGPNGVGIFNNNAVCSNGDSKESARVSDCHINTTCDLTGGTVTITTPSIQSGGCLIQSTDSGIIVQAPRIEIRPKLSGGGCFVQKRLSTDDEDTSQVIYRDGSRGDDVSPAGDGALDDGSKLNGRYSTPPSGCQELPGIRRCVPSMRADSESQQPVDTDSMPKVENPNAQALYPSVAETERDQRCWRHPAHRDGYLSQQQQQQQQRHNSFCNSVMGSEIKKRHSTCCCGSGTREEGPSCTNSAANPNRPVSSTVPMAESIEKNSLPVDKNGSMEIRVNATVQLPPNIGHCTVNIIATTGSPGGAESSRTENNGHGRTRNNFNGGGLVQVDGNVSGLGNEANLDRREEAPTTPLSWLTPCPWGFENYFQDKDYTRIAEVKRLLQTSGWYHEGLSWQQSENLLKNSPVGSWLMRDSSDSRFVFAVSVQTPRGPTSVRVHYYLGKFRLDAEPRLSHAMPVFDCPMKMLEHYVDYSKRIDEHRKEVWVDYSGQIYSQIYLTKPLVKEVSSLSHLARLVVNKNKLSTDNLPPLMKNYLAEYPYSL